MSESENIIDFTLTEDDITEALERDDENHPIMIESEEKNTLLDGKMEMILRNLKGKFLNEAIASYKAKCHQFIEQRKAERLANYLKQQAKDIVERSLGYQIEKLPEDEINPALYLTYLRENSILE